MLNLEAREDLDTERPGLRMRLMSGGGATVIALPNRLLIFLKSQIFGFSLRCFLILFFKFGNRMAHSIYPLRKFYFIACSYI
jgi:hypothetical protein